MSGAGLRITRRQAVRLLVGCLLGGLILGLTWWKTQPSPREAFEPNARHGYALKRESSSRHRTENFDVAVRTNAYGLRGEIDTARGEDYRILALGDSFTFGWGVEEEQSWTTLLEQKLSSPARAVQVINAGVPGWSTLHEYVFLRSEGFGFEPDLVLLQLTNNDLRELDQLSFEVDERGLPLSLQAHSPTDQSFLQQVALRLQARGVEDFKELLKRHRAGERDPAVTEVIHEIREENRLAAGVPPHAEIAELSADELRRGLTTGTAFQARYATHLLSGVITLCAERQVELRIFVVDNGAVDSDAELLRATVQELGIPWLDSRSFLPSEDEAEVFWPRDRHWRPERHPEVAEHVAEWMKNDAALDLQD